MGFLSGMQSVGLQQLGLQGDVLQDEWCNLHPARYGEFAEQSGIGARVSRAVIRRDLHAGQDRDRTAIVDHSEQRRQIFLDGGERQAAQSVVRAELDEYDARSFRVEQRGQARKSARRGLAADARVDDAIPEPSVVDPPLQQCRPGAGDVDTVAGTQTVAEDEQRRLDLGRAGRA